MNYTVQEHELNSVRIAEVLAEELVVKSSDDALQLLGDLYYSGFDAIVFHQQHLAPDFFDLKTGMAGEILQKFSNYRMRLFLVGDFSDLTSQSMIDFIRESNTGKQVNFVNSMEEVLTRI